ncbi:uncharacterized protein BO72DRAFT_285027 [Aspergillus fijiensis CBS 313.89]|uniref:Uncharacterized protein n=1 Tax=Aspergillus fijiensis CBS 313.89 TaxID=1448319 RepID=A0A8G1RZJ4_9EURO|nr:uncharacterized protein BO72DRAFT_285027 [Aspergillus fijiensis CBS 313.89]RAK80635.1 hypothetical protein BO72DRAFT_285027 [Aspergillus fijiensis CBS 313.89]
MRDLQPCSLSSLFFHPKSSTPSLSASLDTVRLPCLSPLHNYKYEHPKIPIMIESSSSSLNPRPAVASCRNSRPGENSRHADMVDVVFVSSRLLTLPGTHCATAVVDSRSPPLF